MRHLPLARRVTWLALLALPLFARAAHAAPEDLLDQYSATDRFRSGTPRAFQFTPDGATLYFLRSGPRDRVNDLYALDLKSRQEKVVLTATQLLNGANETMTAAEKARRERLRLSARGIASFTVSEDGAHLLVPLSGRLFLVDRANGAVRELSPGASSAADARFSPDGKRIACVRGAQLCVIDVASGAEHVVSPKETASPDSVLWGSPEFVAQEEMDRFEGYWWAPDSRHLVAQRNDESRVERLRIFDPYQPASPPQEFAYPRPGTTNTDVTLAILDAGAGAGSGANANAGPPVWVRWDRAAMPYLCRVKYDAHGPLALLVMDRVQQHEVLLTADVHTGATTPLLKESDGSWLNLPEGAPQWLGANAGWLWIAERDDSGPWLEMRGANGAPVRLTPPGLRVAKLLAVDQARRVAYIEASKDATQPQVWRVPLRARMAPQPLGEGAGVHTAEFSHDGSHWVHTYRPERGRARVQVEDALGDTPVAVRSVGETPPYEANIEWTRAGKDSLAAFIVRPRDFDPRKRYPVIDWAYGGPHSLRVTRTAGAYLMEQWLADKGFIVVTVDGRGTPGRGRSWERAIRGDFISAPLADHEQGLRALCAAHPDMDADRIGVTGWSFGGYYTVLALERMPEFYKAGVAGAPVVDWQDYDTFYTERYVGLPQRDSLAYAHSSALTDASRLSRPLLVEHGTADDNVYFFHTLKLADALNRAGRSWELLPFPGQTHAIFDAAQVRQLNGRRADFLRQHLGVPSDAAPPRP